MTMPTLAALSESIENDLLRELTIEAEAVEEELAAQVVSQSNLVDEVCKHTLRAGGKRLRPAFVLIGARATGNSFDRQQTRRIGTCMEMIHMATLIHDDVIDNSATRRGRPTASAVFGNRASILSGDALLAKATRLLTQNGDLRLIQIVSDAVVDMAVGEVKEVEQRGVFDLEEGVHLEILRLKTASFIQACCESGAHVAGASPDVLNALRVYGQEVGLAFQLADDLLDYRGDKAKTGKAIGTDFAEGQATLPLIYLRETLTSSEQEYVQGCFGAAAGEQDIRKVSGWMAERGCFERCEAKAAEHIQTAMRAAESLPDPSSNHLLSSVANYVLGRNL